mgnify:CR=1 FL=1
MRGVVLFSLWMIGHVTPALTGEPAGGFGLSGDGDFRIALAGTSETVPALHSAAGEETGAFGMKDPRLGALFSAVLPGTGEFYGGAWLRGAAFLGAEFALWAGYAHFSGKGQDWDDRFHDYANGHWSEPRYWVGVAGEAGILGVTESNYTDFLTELRAYERANNSHALHVEKDQQYYEMIGKYDQFRYGWDDWEEGRPALTPNRDWYETMRHRSNQEFKKASTCAMIVLANHVVSALDAAWTISRGNRKIKTAMRFDMRPVRNEMVPFYGFHVTW